MQRSSYAEGLVGHRLELCWKPYFCGTQLLTTENPNPMNPNDFSAFRSLLSDVHHRAFGEQITMLPYAKAQMLSWLIEETTGNTLSYKSLSKYTSAVLSNDPLRVNPHVSTLAILAKFIFQDEAHLVGRQSMRMTPCAAWFRYRSKVLAYNLAV